jgi:hypothetical protein
MAEKLSSLEAGSLDAMLDSRIRDICEESSNFLGQAECLATMMINPLSVGENGLHELSSLVQTLSAHTIELGSRIVDEQQRWPPEKRFAAGTKILGKRNLSIPRDALDLKAAIASRLRTLAKRDVKVIIVAEAAEIENDRWRNVIEGYLNTQKYYITFLTSISRTHCVF